MEYPDSCSTAMRCVARKVAAIEGGLVWFGGGFTMGMLFLDGWTCIWHSSALLAANYACSAISCLACCFIRSYNYFIWLC